MNGHAGSEENGEGGEEDGGGRGAVIGASPSASSVGSHHNFPAVFDASSPTTPPAHVLKDFPTRKRESMMLYHNVVLDNIIDSEGQFVNDMRALISTVLIPLRLRCGAPIGGGGVGGADSTSGEGVEEASRGGDLGNGSESSKEDVICSSLPNNNMAVGNYVCIVFPSGRSWEMPFSMCH